MIRTIKRWLARRRLQRQVTATLNSAIHKQWMRNRAAQIGRR